MSKRAYNNLSNVWHTLPEPFQVRMSDGTWHSYSTFAEAHIMAASSSVLAQGVEHVVVWMDGNGRFYLVSGFVNGLKIYSLVDELNAAAELERSVQRAPGSIAMPFGYRPR